MMNISEMIIDLKQKNVKFNLIIEEAAKDYLKYNNNYYNITLFKHNFQIEYKTYLKIIFIIKFERIKTNMSYFNDII